MMQPPKTVLLVEDEPVIAMDLEALLADLGCTVVTCPSAQQGAQAVATHGVFDAAVMDHGLPGGGADELADLLLGSGVPILFCTGRDRHEIPERFADVPVIGKPFRNEDIAAELEKLLSK